MTPDELRKVLEVALLAAEQPLSLDTLVELVQEGFLPRGGEDAPTRAEIRAAVRSAIGELQEACGERAVELREVASGYRYQVRPRYAGWVARLLAERPARYSRALLETLALIAYRQPITRGEIEEIRGVSISASIMRTLHEREWVRVLGHREVPGRPALYGTTRRFLDDFNLTRLEDLPPLGDIRDLESLHADLFEGVETGTGVGTGEAAGTRRPGASAAAAGGGDAAASPPGGSDPSPGFEMSEGGGVS